jgi:hypothetical protein
MMEVGLYDEIFKFLLSSPTPQQIIHLQPSEALQARVSALLAANRERKLLVDEEAELDEIENLNHFISMFKFYARRQVRELTQTAAPPPSRTPARPRRP